MSKLRFDFMRHLLGLITFSAISLLAFGQEADFSVTEIAGPIPVIVSPGISSSAAPSDAIILFDGTSLAEWESVDGGEPAWSVNDGMATVVPSSSDIRTRRHFGDVQLHVEWRTPSIEMHNENLQSDAAQKVLEDGARAGVHQHMANSGVFLQERYEIQVLETYGLQTYVNGQAGSIYKQYAPQVDASRKPGEWQTYDIVYQAPSFTAQGQLSQPARLTLLHNGVLVHNNVAIWGATEFIGLPKYMAHGPAPLMLQRHAGVSQVSYRNIWIREL